MLLNMSVSMADRELTAHSFKLVGIKLVTASKEHLEKHYEDLAKKPFFPGLVSCMFLPPPAPHFLIID
jgi:nucleoside diphosphate kinase